MTQENKTIIWTEDSKSGYVFWMKFFEILLPEAIVESKKNNSELVKAVSNLLQDDNNKYIIIMDQAFDNPQVIRERKRLLDAIQKRNNVYVINIISFEYLLLQFKCLPKWVFAEDDNLREKRERLLEIRNRLVSILKGLNSLYYLSDEYIKAYCESCGENNVEQLCARLLFDITRNTGFEVSKKAVGPCWIRNCCEWRERAEDDICGLDDARISVRDKMCQIYNYSADLVKEFKAVGVEVKSDNDL